MPFENDNPFMPWNNPPHDDNPFAAWNNPRYEDDPFAPWNSPIASKGDLDRYYERHHISQRHRFTR